MGRLKGVRHYPKKPLHVSAIKWELAKYETILQSIFVTEMKIASGLLSPEDLEHESKLLDRLNSVLRHAK